MMTAPLSWAQMLRMTLTRCMSTSTFATFTLDNQAEVNQSDVFHQVYFSLFSDEV